MNRLTLFLYVVIITILLNGCTLHFKATDVELDTESNTTYTLESADIFADAR